MENVLTLDRLEIENKNEKDVNDLAVEMLREACEGMGIKVFEIPKVNKTSVKFIKRENAIAIYSNATSAHVKTMLDIISHIIPTKVSDGIISA